MTTPKTAPKKRASATIASVATNTEDETTGGATARAPTPRAAARPVVPKPKQKLVRDSFTIPKPEYAVLDALKLRAARLMRPTKKSEVLRAGIFALNAMDDRAFLATLGSVPSLKTGRPKNEIQAVVTPVRRGAKAAPT